MRLVSFLSTPLILSSTKYLFLITEYNGKKVFCVITASLTVSQYFDFTHIVVKYLPKVFAHHNQLFNLRINALFEQILSRFGDGLNRKCLHLRAEFVSLGHYANTFTRPPF